MAQEEFWLQAELRAGSRYRVTGRVVCPALAGWPATRAEILAHMPLRDANGLALAWLARSRPAADALVAFFAGDPFLHLPTALRAARRAGARALAAYPTAQIFDGEAARGVASAGYGVAADVAFVRAARAAGFEALGFAVDLAAARALLVAGATRGAPQPAPAGPDARANRAALAALEAARAALGDAPVLIHRAIGYDPAALDRIAARARGAVRLQPSMPKRRILL
jgi:hypothetical protein